MAQIFVSVIFLLYLCTRKSTLEGYVSSMEGRLLPSLLGGSRFSYSVGRMFQGGFEHIDSVY